jgi:copper chaperone
MKSIQFKTNLKCNGCVNAIKPNIEAINEVKSWRVFLDVQEKTLEVDYDTISEDEILDAVQDAVTKAGYNIEKL